jgi:hypothetical protein
MASKKGEYRLAPGATLPAPDARSAYQVSLRKASQLRTHAAQLANLSSPMSTTEASDPQFKEAIDLARVIAKA